jgi:transmembrane sensor
MAMKDEIEQDLCGDAQHDAAVWYAYLKRPERDERAWTAFTEWLERDQRHRIAYDAVERLHESLDEVGDELLLLLAERPASAKILPLGQRRVGRIWVAAAALAALAASLLIVFLPRIAAPPAQRYETRAGETKSVTLADGTLVDLNRDTALSATMTASGRRIELERGEALFHVAADPRRPFVVAAGRAEIRDIGTIFDVVRTRTDLVVSVEQGRVAVMTPGATAPTLLAAGDRLAAKEGGPATLSHGDPAATSSWAKGFLVYQNAPFSKLVSDLNRYGQLEIVQESADSAFAPFSGVLEIADQDIMLERLGHMIPLALERSQKGRILVRALPAAK